MVARRIIGRKALRAGFVRRVAEIPEGQQGGEEEQVRPEGQKLVGAVVGVGGEGEGNDRPEEWGGEEEEGEPAASHPTHVALRHEWGTRTFPAEQEESREGGGHGPEKVGLAVGVEEQAEAGEAALGGEGDGPVEVVAQAGGDVKGEQRCGERGCGPGEQAELRGDGEVVEAAGSGDDCDGQERDGEEGKADVLLDEKRENADGSGESIADAALACALQEVEGEEDGEDGVTVVDRVGVDTVNAEEDEG